MGLALVFFFFFFFQGRFAGIRADILLWAPREAMSPASLSQTIIKFSMPARVTRSLCSSYVVLFMREKAVFVRTRAFLRH